MNNKTMNALDNMLLMWLIIIIIYGLGIVQIFLDSKDYDLLADDTGLFFKGSAIAVCFAVASILVGTVGMPSYFAWKNSEKEN